MNKINITEKGFRVVLLEPNIYSLKIARRKANELNININILKTALPRLPICDNCFNAVDFYWGLHTYPDEEKLGALIEIKRVMAHGGLLFSTSFGSLSGCRVPTSMYLVPKKEDFIAWHEKAGLRTLEVTEIIDEIYSWQKSWCGEFKAEKK